MSITLRPYQDKFETDIRGAYAGGAKSVLAVLPTGGGKTVVFSDMAAKAAARGNSVGITAHRVEILEQIGRALEARGVPHGYLAPGFAPNPLAQVQVCSVGAMARRIDRYHRNPFKFLIVDEAHHAAAGTQWHAVINAHTPDPSRPQAAACRILGVTATPQRLSGEPLSVAFDEMIVGPSTSELIQLGALSKYRLFAPFRPDMSGAKRQGGDYKKSDAAGIMDKPTITGDAVAHYKRIASGKRAIVFCVSIEHAEHVAAQFSAAGLRASSLDGKMDRKQRRAILAAFERGEIEVLTSCDIVSEGFDVPAIEVAILLRPTESLALYLQQVGRALRPFPGKDYAIILDHAGNSVERAQGGRGHGLPDDVRAWSLEGVKGRDKAAGERTIPTVICGGCYATFRPSQPCCPYCGFERDILGRTIKVTDGELVEVDPDLVRQARQEEIDAQNTRIRQTRKVEDLAALGVELGKSAGWLWNLYRNRPECKSKESFPYGRAVTLMRDAKMMKSKESA